MPRREWIFETEAAETQMSICRCGAAALSIVGAPISLATCHCESCKVAARELEIMGVGFVGGTDGGVDYVLFLKDCVILFRGRDKLMDHCLTTDAPTRRVVATCCNSAMFLDFAPGFWISVYHSSLAEQIPAPSARTYTPRFFLKLMSAWVAMGFLRPKLSF